MTNTLQKRSEVPAIEKSPTALLLEYPFRPDQIKKRPGGGGRQLDYIEGSTVIQRLNDCFGFDGWSFDVLEQREANDEAIIKGRLTVYTGDRIVTREQFGSHAYTVKRDTGEIISKGVTLKAAGTDCLKKCASLLGIGLHIYGNAHKSFRSELKE